MVPNSDVSNFSFDWKDGVLFYRLVNIVLMDTDPPPPSDCRNEVESVMDLASRIGNVPMYITPNEFTDASLDSLPLMTYIALIKSKVEQGDYF